MGIEWLTGKPQMIIQALFFLFGVLGYYAISYAENNPHSVLRRRYFLQLMGVSGGAFCLLFIDPSQMDSLHMFVFIRLALLLIFLAWLMIVLGLSGTSVVLSALGCYRLFRESRWQPTAATEESPAQTE